MITLETVFVEENNRMLLNGKSFDIVYPVEPMLNDSITFHYFVLPEYIAKTKIEEYFVWRKEHLISENEDSTLLIYLKPFSFINQ